MRMILGILAGMVVAFACVAGIETLGHIMYPPPPGFDLTNPRDVDRLMSMMPAAALGFVLAAWFVGALAGALVANLIARRALAGWIIAMLVIAAAVATMVMIPASRLDVGGGDRASADRRLRRRALRAGASLRAQAFSSVHWSGCWFSRARSITWVILVSAIS